MKKFKDILENVTYEIDDLKRYKLRGYVAMNLIRLSKVVGDSGHVDFFDDEKDSIMVRSDSYGIYGMIMASGKLANIECYSDEELTNHLDKLEEEYWAKLENNK